jgi:hypothetical protein
MPMATARPLRFNELGATSVSLLQLEPHATLEITLPITGELHGTGFDLGGTFTAGAGTVRRLLREIRRSST